MDKDERALNWLKEMCTHSAHVFDACRVQDMLAEPRLPAEPTPLILATLRHAMVTAQGSADDVVRAMYLALHDCIAKPAKPVWRIWNTAAGTYTDCAPDAVEEIVRDLRRLGAKSITVTMVED